jgi:uncharacterized protein
VTALVLVVAKAPVPGLAKTRLCPPATPAEAAEIAAASLLDTLDAVRETSGVRRAVALTGDLDQAARGAQLREALQDFTVLPQRGRDFADRLANAHLDASRAHSGLPVLQIGMDTPQVTPDLLARACHRLSAGDAVLGLASDGGWWLIGFRCPTEAGLLRDVPMSCTDTGENTHAALRSAGLAVAKLPTLSDVDTMTDAERVAASIPCSRFAASLPADIANRAPGGPYPTAERDDRHRDVVGPARSNGRG